MHQCFGIKTWRSPGKPYPSREMCLVRLHADYSTESTKMDALAMLAMHEEIDRLNNIVNALKKQIAGA